MASTTKDQDQRPKPSSLRSIIAGATAGAVEIAITYPAECALSPPNLIQPNGTLTTRELVAKTRSQLNRRLPDAGKLPWPPFGAQWYAGCFVAFDKFKALLQDENGNISGPRTVIAGFGAGFTESILAVTPFESIKTQLIDDRKSANPRMRGFLQGSKIIAQERGIRGFFQGLVPTTARQAANSAVRFSSYTTIKQFVQGYAAPGEKLGVLSTFAIGGVAGIITVYVTQPLDTVKTRMQSLEARKNYKNSIACFVQIVKNEGTRK
uniref:Putative mitochondrial carrier C19G12.05 n=1 Tax=Talaromyces marneffei PM1 TaxID=1077442 RepID=A0A093X9H3_TALMA